MENTIIIYIIGGCVGSVHTNIPNLQYVLVDENAGKIEAYYPDGAFKDAPHLLNLFDKQGEEILNVLEDLSNL